MCSLSKLATAAVKVANANLRSTAAAKQNQLLNVDALMRVAQITNANMIEGIIKTTIKIAGKDTIAYLNNSKRIKFSSCGSNSHA
jgi:hypothetical protein